MNSNPDDLSNDQMLDKLIKKHPIHDSILMNHFVEDIMIFMQRYITENNSSIILYNIDKDSIIFNKSDITHYLYPTTVSLDITNNRKQINLITHPDDIEFWDKINLLTYELLMSMPVEELNTFRVVGSRRLKEKDGRYHSYIQRIEPLVLSEIKYPMYLMVKIYRPKEEEIPQFRLYSHYAEDFIEKHKYSNMLKTFKLCSREEEALNLYIEENTEKKIALIMKVKLATIKGYFRSVKKKMNVPSIKVAALLWKLLKEFSY